MSDPTDGELIREICTEVLALPEVVRLEPTLRGRLRQLGSGRADGVTLMTRQGRTQVTVEVAISGSGRPAVVVAEAIKALVGGVLTRGGREAGPIRVAVLAVESGTESGTD